MPNIKNAASEGGKDWQKLQNLLIQLLLVCDQ